MFIFKIVCVIFFSFFVMTSCKGISDIEIYKGKKFKNEANLINSNETNINGVEYEVFIKNHTVNKNDGSSFGVQYAAIEGLDNELVQKKINKTLETSITSWMDENCEWFKYYDLSIMHKSSKYISVLYYREWNSSNEGVIKHKSSLGITVDLESGEILSLYDFYKEEDELKTMLEKYTFEDTEFCGEKLSSEKVEKIIVEASLTIESYLKKVYKSDKNAYSFIKSYVSRKNSFYLTENYIVITDGDYELCNLYLKLKND